MKNLILLSFCFMLIACGQTPQQNKESESNYKLDEQAHRGGRGLMPENTIPAMINSIDLDVTTLELDLQISKDKQVLVSHDPYFNENITTTPDGKFLTKEESRAAILYGMDYAEIKKYDVGMKPHPDFPNQKKIAVSKPLLSDLLEASEAHAEKKGKSILYNIEIKSSAKKQEANMHPPVEEFVELAIAVMNKANIIDRTVIQSFDKRAIQIINKKYPHIQTSYLVEKNVEGTIQEQLEDLGFKPTIYSPPHSLVTKELVDYCHSQDIKVISWTPNNIETLQKQYDMGVDGIITDYPNLFEELRKANK